MLELKDLGFSYDQGGFSLSDISLRAEVGTRVAIIGRSGCGKSTLIKLLGGHLMPSAGAIYLNQEEITRLEPGMRGVSTVFQDLALFPHLTVFRNVEFPLAVRRLRTERRRHDVEVYLTRFGIWDRRDFKPAQLSGGEQQRTALARGLISGPSLLLLDEPTAALDGQQKARLATFLNEMLQQESVPLVVIVTHDYEFAFSVCDYLAVMKDGRLIAQAPTEQLLRRPENVEAAQILDSFSVIHGAVDLNGVFRSENGNITFPVYERDCDYRGERCAVLLRSDAIRLDAPSQSGFVTNKGIVASVQVRGIYSRVRLGMDDQVILCDWFRDKGPRPTQGQTITFSFAIVDAQLVPVKK